jgi:hypothetical protein
VIDWEKLTGDQLEAEGLGSAIEPEVAAELAHHLESVCESWLSQGLSEAESIQRAWAEVKNWPRLARKINQAREGEEMLRQRIQRLWLPAIVPMILAWGILFAGQEAGRRPRLLEISPKMSVFMYLAWLLILPAMGALAAYWSRRAGGSVTNRAAAALFTAVSMLWIWLVVLIHGIFADHGTNASSVLSDLISSSVGAVLLPAVALLAGASPFLRGTRKTESLSEIR